VRAQITPVGQPPYFVLIDRVLRDEGASYHYLPLRRLFTQYFSLSSPCACSVRTS
jgi:hypothetical protein